MLAHGLILMATWIHAGIQPEQIMVLPTSRFQQPHALVQQIAAWVNHTDDYMTPRLKSVMDGIVHHASNSKGRIYPIATSKALEQYFAPYNRALLELLETLPFVRPDAIETFEVELKS